jgi:hypothetical protein
MKKALLLLPVLFVSNLLTAADPSPKDALLKAAQGLADKPSFSWKTTISQPGEPTGTIVGKTEKEGATVLSLARGDQSYEAVLKGAKIAIKDDEGWKSVAEATADDGGQRGAIRFVARLVQSYKAPPAEITELAGKLKDLKESDGTYAGDLSEETVKEVVLYRTRGGTNPPEINGAKGSVKFWVKDGLPTKIELHVEAKVTFNGNEREVNRTHVTEIKDVGATKATVPEEAAKKL